MKKLFGTDGIRGVAGAQPLDPTGVSRFGAALAAVLQGDGRGHPRVVLGRDTRESGPWLRDAVGAGLNSRDAVAVDIGVITTPGLAHVVRTEGYDAGVMISASHNPFEDNGLKVFGRTGMKLADSLERRIEELILGDDLLDPGNEAAHVSENRESVRRYVEHLEGVIIPRPGGSHRGPFAGVRLVLDCANGSACDIAPEIFRHYGADVVTIGDSPTGRNINLDCGSLHLDALALRVRQEGCILGIAFDGDADRVLAVASDGRVVDGDHILYLTARRLKRSGRLSGDSLVATIMSNLWLEKRLEEDGITLHRAPVGDKYVLERMLTENAVLGGEQSGHVIFLDHATTGDGILTGLMLLETLVAEGLSLDSFLDEIAPCPQLLLNVRVREKPDLREHPVIGPAVDRAEGALKGSGRVVLRYSGTEPLARVMVEGTDEQAVRDHAERLARVIGDELGV